MGGRKGSLAFADAGGSPYIGYVCGTTYRWALAVQQEEREAFNTLWRMRRFAYIVLAAAVGIVLAVAWFLARSLVRPIRKLTEAADRMSLGDLNVEIKATSRDEIGIHNSCSSVERRINSPVSAILLEAMRLRDEAQEEERKQRLESAPRSAAIEQTTGQGRMNSGTRSPVLHSEKLRSALAAMKGVEDIYRDSSWNYLLELSHHVRGALKIGPLRVAFVANEGQDANLVLVPGKDTTVVVIEKYSLKEEILEKILLVTKNR